MPAILTQRILPAPGTSAWQRRLFGRCGLEIKHLQTGRAEVVQVDLALPFGLSGRARRKAYARALARMIDLGMREAVLPGPLEAEGLRLGLQPCDDLPALRRLAARAVLDVMGRQAPLGQVRAHLPHWMQVLTAMTPGFFSPMRMQLRSGSKVL